MQKIYKNQTALTFKLDTKIDLTAATAAVIKYSKPGTPVVTGSWTADIDTPVSDGIISYDIDSADDLDESGQWTIWAYVTFTGGLVAPGDPYKFIVYEQGT
jgi:hypothetical protein